MVDVIFSGQEDKRNEWEKESGKGEDYESEADSGFWDCAGTDEDREGE